MRHDFNPSTSMTRVTVYGKDAYSAALYLRATTTGGAVNGDSWRMVGHVHATGTLTLENNASGSFVEKLSLNESGNLVAAGTARATAIGIGRAPGAAGTLETTADIFIAANGPNGLVLIDNQGTPHKWRVTVSNVGALQTTDLGAA
jgi:hypothetical protein